ncbi:hypothetical protein BAOM_2110 [Peribacillus asahii]|uniref:Uncharacterized protein n=1 Tax=Peribacillus asahii TaxID=228899 RepID=A0A3Q9RM23_9BACI|nr:hypothetical protein [Peribacillus asahii]AZV42719.1 hypothetical protein BAOM_2110 [Peribacillus asahii]
MKEFIEVLEKRYNSSRLINVNKIISVLDDQIFVEYPTGVEIIRHEGTYEEIKQKIQEAMGS